MIILIFTGIELTSSLLNSPGVFFIADTWDLQFNADSEQSIRENSRSKDTFGDCFLRK